MTKSTAGAAVTSLMPPVLQLFLGLFLLYVINEIIGKFLGLGEKTK